MFLASHCLSDEYMVTFLFRTLEIFQGFLFSSTLALVLLDFFFLPQSHCYLQNHSHHMQFFSGIRSHQLIKPVNQQIESKINKQKTNINQTRNEKRIQNATYESTLQATLQQRELSCKFLWQMVHIYSLDLEIEGIICCCCD